MHPVLFKFGAFELRSYGLMLALSFLLGIWLAVYRAKKVKTNTNIILDLALVIIVSSIVGARLMYVVFHFEEFKGNWFAIINPIQSSGGIGISGMTVIGGILLSIIASLIYLKLNNQPILKIADIMSPSVGLGIFLTRIGCYLNGCCFGHPCDPSAGVVFPPNSPAGAMFAGQHIIPTQLYSSLYGLFLFVIVILAEKKYYKFDGFTFYLFFALYGVARFVIDFFRYYETSMILVQFNSISISVNQGVSLFLMLFFGSLFILGLYRTRKMT